MILSIYKNLEYYVLTHRMCQPPVPLDLLLWRVLDIGYTLRFL